MPGEYDHASELVQRLAYKQSTCADPKYIQQVEKAIVEAVTEANRTRTSIRTGVGKGIEDKVAFNRRFQMRSGLAVTHPGQLNPDIVEPAGPVDPEVGVIGVWNKDGKLIGCVVNFACHATTSPGGISANYVYYLEKVIQAYYGKDVVVVFLNGASGDVAQVDNRSPYQNYGPEKWAEFVGGRIGAEALKVLLTIEPGALTPVAAHSRVLTFARRLPSPERVRRCLEIVKQDPQKVDPTEWTFAKEIVLFEAKRAKEPTVAAEVQAIQVGPVVFLADPAEYFCAFGLQLKAHSGFPFTFPVSLANGCVGYVPTEEAFGPHGGGYETRLTSYSNLDITAGRQMAEASLQPGKGPEAGIGAHAGSAAALQGQGVVLRRCQAGVEVVRSSPSAAPARKGDPTSLLALRAGYIYLRSAAAIRASSANSGPLVGMEMWKTSAITCVQPWRK